MPGVLNGRMQVLAFSTLKIRISRAEGCCIQGPTDGYIVSESGLTVKVG
jgi:hypothetical protein